MKKIVKILNDYFEDKKFATYKPKGEDNLEMIDFPFGLIANDGGLIIHFSLDAPPHLIFQITRALKDIDIEVCTDAVYVNEDGVFWHKEAFKKYAQDLAWEYIDDSSSYLN